MESFETKAFNKYIIEKSGIYKPVLPLPSSPGEEWLETLEGNMKESVEHTIHPQAKFGSYQQSHDIN